TLELSWRPQLCGGFWNQVTYGLPAQESVQNTAVGQQMEHTSHRATKQEKNKEIIWEAHSLIPLRGSVAPRSVSDYLTENKQGWNIESAVGRGGRFPPSASGHGP